MRNREQTVPSGPGTLAGNGTAALLFLGFAPLFTLALRLIGFATRQSKGLTHSIDLGLLAPVQLTVLTSCKIDYFIAHNRLQNYLLSPA